MQLGFVIDQSRCIGCHACTVACKAENDVPLGSFRTWVKYTESGTFPDVRRSFAVLRCNQCTDAPCVSICPVRALEKRPDGVVDVDPAWCIGCKGCLQACPYDALYMNDATGTAEKCHFCAHRVEIGLAPACAVVCPTEAIVPGDFHDPRSRVSRMRAAGGLAARKPDAGTGPNVLYRKAHPAGMDPLRTRVAGGFLWADRFPGTPSPAEAFDASESAAPARTVYDVAHAPAWGWKITAYLFAKSLASGIVLAPAAAALLSGRTPLGVPPWAAALGLVLTLLTAGLLVADLKRPCRFLHILRRPNPRSWIARGAWILGAYGGLLGLWVALGLLRWRAAVPLLGLLQAATVLAAALTAAYTAWLFGQARGRPLWMKRGLALHLLVQALVAGSALHLLVGCLPPAPTFDGSVAAVLVLALLAHGLLVLLEGGASPRRREEEYERAAALLVRGPYARRLRILSLGTGTVLPAALLLLLPWAGAGAAWTGVVLGSLCALLGLWVYEDCFVRAGQALPIS